MKAVKYHIFVLSRCFSYSKTIPEKLPIRIFHWTAKVLTISNIQCVSLSIVPHSDYSDLIFDRFWELAKIFFTNKYTSNH